MLKACEKLMQKVIHAATGERLEDVAAIRDRFAEGDDGLHDAMAEVRGGEVRTGLSCEWSRHYESVAVAAPMLDGSWVGWTYWYGGGKHGEPESIGWIDEAYDVTMTEVMRPVKQFARTDGAT